MPPVPPSSAPIWSKLGWPGNSTRTRDVPVDADYCSAVLRQLKLRQALVAAPELLVDQYLPDSRAISNTFSGLTTIAAVSDNFGKGTDQVGYHGHPVATLRAEATQSLIKGREHERARRGVRKPFKNSKGRTGNLTAIHARLHDCRRTSASPRSHRQDNEPQVFIDRVAFEFSRTTANASISQDIFMGADTSSI